MISPQMSFRENIQLSISELDEAKAFAHDINDKFSSIIKESFPEKLFQTDFQELNNGNMLHNIYNDSFKGTFEIVVGWDQKNIAGQNIKFMALNTSGRGEAISFSKKEPSISKLPDKAYYAGGIGCALAGFALCMWYAQESDDFNMILFFVVIIVIGWIGLKLGTFFGTRLQDSAYDRAQAEAMNDQLFLQSGGPWLAFSEKISILMKKTAEENSTAEE